MAIVELDFLCHADFSGRLRKTKENVGFCAFAAQIDELRQKNPSATLLLDAGDAFSVNFWGGKPVVGALNLLETDVLTLGNHEFDRGENFLESCINECDFPVLCANIKKKRNSEPVLGTLPYIIIEKQGVKIGVLGLTTEYTPYMVEKSAFEPFEVTNAVSAAKQYIPIMRQQGAKIIVALTHFPFYFTPDNNISGELADFLSEIPQIDICIGGHIPGDYAQIVSNTCVLKAGFAGASIGHAGITFDTSTNTIIDKKCNIVLTKPNAVCDEKISEYVNGVIAPFEEYFSAPLAIANEYWSIKLAVETKAGDFFADCMRDAFKTQIGYMNATSCGGFIEPGEVTRETLMNVVGFNDPIFTGVITGKQLYNLIETVYEPNRFGNNAALLFSGFILKIDHNKNYPNKTQQITLEDGTPINPNEEYTIATSAYMASGGNDTGSIANKIKWKKTDMYFYDAVFNYAKKIKVLNVKQYPRIIAQGHPENDNSPF